MAYEIIFIYIWPQFHPLYTANQPGSAVSAFGGSLRHARNVIGRFGRRLADPHGGRQQQGLAGIVPRGGSFPLKKRGITGGKQRKHMISP